MGNEIINVKTYTFTAIAGVIPNLIDQDGLVSIVDDDTGRTLTLGEVADAFIALVTVGEVDTIRQIERDTAFVADITTHDLAAD